MSVSLTTTPDPESVTTAHILAVPTVLQNTSPNLAALHLAKARLLFSISANDPLLNRWCHSCGGLREGFKDRKRGNKRARLAGVCDKASKFDGIGTSKAGNSRGNKCTLCGEAYRRPKPDPSTKNGFPPARSTRRSAKSQAAAEASTSSPSSSSLVDSVPQSHSLDNSVMTRRITTLSHSSLSHITTDPPNPPTYPKPEPTVKTSTSDGKKGKRKKKSGLAKLLAENRERSSGSTGKSWGLD